MFESISVRQFGIDGALSACRNLKAGRLAAAGLCVLFGISAASLISWQNPARVAPAQVVAVSASNGSNVVSAADAIAQMRRVILAPAALLKTSTDLNLAESGLFGEQKAEQFLASAISIAPSERASVVDIHVVSGAPAFDALIANHLARGLTSPSAAQALTEGATATPARFMLVAKSRVIPAASVLLYQVEIIILSLLAAASVIALGVARELRKSNVKVAAPAKPPAVVPRGILEQIDMLERMWPETGRHNSMPEGSNDEPEQVELKPARDIVVRMAELRQDARHAIQQPSEDAFEDVLTDMQSLRDQVRWITAEQLRRRRRVNSFGR